MTGATRDRFYQAIDDYNRGEYMSAQEALEALYAETPREEQPLVRALLAASCAMYLHFQRGGGRGVLNLLRQSLLLLDDLRPRRLGVEVDELFDALQAYLDDLKDRRKPGARFLDRWIAPRIRYHPEPE